MSRKLGNFGWASIQITSTTSAEMQTHLCFWIGTRCEVCIRGKFYYDRKRRATAHTRDRARHCTPGVAYRRFDYPYLPGNLSQSRIAVARHFVRALPPATAYEFGAVSIWWQRNFKFTRNYHKATLANYTMRVQSVHRRRGTFIRTLHSCTRGRCCQQRCC